MKLAVVLVIDGLGAGHLGPYGNTWINTPAFNRLASRGCLFERVLGDTSDVRLLYRSFWQGLHALCPPAPEAQPRALVEELATAGVESVLITDAPPVADHPLSARFSQQIALPTPEAHEADSIGQTHFARLLAVAAEEVSAAAGGLVWIHSIGMYGPWDAPQELRRSLADEDDPQPPDIVAPPSRTLPADVDPDERLGIVQAYGGQVMAVDACLEALLEVLEHSLSDGQTLLIVTGARGYPLGEHGGVGAAGRALYGEVLHLPLLIRRFDGQGAGVRSHALVQPADIYAALLDWFGAEASHRHWTSRPLALTPDEAGGAGRERACAADDREQAILTPAWFLRCGRGASLPEAEAGGNWRPPCELFAKPDDYWEVNDVTSRGAPVVEGLLAALAEFERAAASSRPPKLSPLAEILTSHVS